MNAQITERLFGAFPARLSIPGWADDVSVEAVERCWTEKLDDAGRVRYHFQVRSGGRRLRLMEEPGRSMCTVTFG